MSDPEQPPIPPSGDTPKYQLNLEIRRRNVFVTQPEESRDEEDVTQIPIIKEAAGKILDRSRNSLQKTLVLKKEVESDRVSQELVCKRQEYSERMQELEERREEFRLREKEFREKAEKFEKFLKDSEAKQRRATARYQAESRQNDVRKSEIQQLAERLEEKRVRRRTLQDRVTSNRIYEEFLVKMVEKVPDNYLEYGVDSPVKAIIRRYETLSLTNENLVNNLTVLADENESAQYSLEALKRQHDTAKLSVEIGSLLLAVINLAEQCQMKHYGALAEVDLTEKLDMVKEYILEKMQIERLAKKPWEELQVLSNPEDYLRRQKKAVANKESQKKKGPKRAALSAHN